MKKVTRTKIRNIVLIILIIVFFLGSSITAILSLL